MTGAPAPEHVGPSVRTVPNIVDVAGPSHSSTSTISRRTISRRQARLVERGPRLEQPSLEARDTPVDVILEQRSASQKRRYPRRAYFERYEKRSPDSLVMRAPSSSINFARDGVLPRCGCGGPSFVSVVSLFRRCACDAQSSGTSDSKGTSDSTGSTDSPKDDGLFFTRDCSYVSDWISKANPLTLTTRLT